MAGFANPQAAFGYVQDQTYRINAEVIRAEYPMVDINDLIPVETQGDPWASGVTTYSIDGAGKPRWVHGHTNTIPLAEVVRGRTDLPYEMAALGYEVTLEEANKARLLGIPIASEKAFYARQGADQFMYYVGLTGDPLRGITGLINNAGISAGTVTADGTGSSPLWANKTPAQILRDINATIVAPWNATNQILMADTLLLPFSADQYLDITVLPNTSETLKSFILRSNSYTSRTGQPLKIRGLNELQTAGASGTRRMIAYSRSGRVLKYHMPMPFQFLPIWQNGPMSWLTPGIFRIGGADWIRPASAVYADGF